jgi:apolipoprotein D and lipocalin family protein
MMKWVAGALVALALGLSGNADAQSVTPLPKLDLKRFTGTWYEVALYPDKKQKTCVENAVVLFSEQNKPLQFQVVNSCKMKNGFADVQNGNGKVQDKSGDGKLKVTYIWPFSVKYWVMAVGPEYEWALVGNPNHKNLWVISKTPTMKPEVMEEIKSKAAAEGFDPAKLKEMPQRR